MVYIDVRGMTTDFDEFLSEFKNEMGHDYNIKYRKENEIILPNEENWEEAGKAFAQNILCAYHEFYEV